MKQLFMTIVMFVIYMSCVEFMPEQTEYISGVYDIGPEFVGSSLGYVMEDGAYIVGAKGNKIHLKNEHDAVDPSYNELISFIKYDKTDEIIYDYDSFVCADFAERLHDNAEKYGIKCAYVTVEFQNGQIGHAFNMFNTTDNGIVYIDSTGFHEYSPCSSDRIVGVEVGKALWYYEITKCDGYYYPPFVANIVESIEITW